jgi:hypothetical protein
MTNSNKHIELVKKWIEDNDSVSHAQLKTNDTRALAAAAAYVAAAAAYDAAYAAYVVAYAASAAAAYDTADADHWVKRYEELTNEN